MSQCTQPWSFCNRNELFPRNLRDWHCLLIRHSYVASLPRSAGRCPDLARLAKAGTFRPFSDIYLQPLLWCCIWFRGWVITDKVSWERGAIIHSFIARWCWLAVTIFWHMETSFCTQNLKIVSVDIRYSRRTQNSFICQVQNRIPKSITVISFDLLKGCWVVPFDQQLHWSQWMWHWKGAQNRTISTTSNHAKF